MTGGGQGGKEEEGSWINGRRQWVCVERDERESNEASKVIPPFSHLASRVFIYLFWRELFSCPNGSTVFSFQRH